MKTIVILSGVPYDSMKQRPQHFAKYFAQNGYEVLYIFLHDYVNINSEILKSVKTRKQLLNIFSTNHDNVSYLKNKVNFDGNTSKLTILITKIIEIYGEENVFMIATFPEWIEHLESIPENTTLIYDCLDEWEEFLKDVEGFNDDLLYNERKLASIADLVITSAKKLYVKMSYYNKNVYYLPNGVWNKDYQTKSEKGILPADLQDIKQPIVFFMGAVAEWVDMDLIRFVAKLRPQYSFVFVGSQRSKLPQLPNIYYLGSKKYEDLPEYLKHAKVGIIPFKVNNLTAAVTPLKFYEYLSSGTPVVTTIMPDILDLKGSKTALHKFEFVKFIDSYINMDECNYNIEIQEAVATAKSFDWNNLLKPIVSLIEGELVNSETKVNFLKKIIPIYKQYQHNDLIKNELLNVYCSLGKYEDATNLFVDNINNEQVDYEKLALSHIKINQCDQALYFLEQYINKNNKKLLKVYVKSILSEKNYKSLLEIYLLKLSGNIYEALQLTDKLLQKNEPNIKLLGIMTGLYLDIGEYDVAFQLALNSIENLNGLKIEEIFDYYSITFLIRAFAERSEYHLAEEIALSVISISKEWEEQITKYLGDVYVSKHMD